jgi:hypothetical protein
MFRDTGTGEVVNMTRVDEGVRQGRQGPVFAATSATRFVTVDGDAWEIAARGAAKMTDIYGTVVNYEHVTQATPTSAELQELIGAYESADAETILQVALENGALVLKRRPDTTIRLAPLYKDAFSGQIGTVVFRRNAAGRVTELSVVQDRVWDMRFARREAAPSTAR